MELIKPSYFDTFRCIAERCPDSCCKEWDVLVDDDKAAIYRTLPGVLGDRLRQVLKEEDGAVYMTIENRRCPMWREDGLCRIQAELGEEFLCKTCREFPRLTHDYGDFIEFGLELSCPEAARIILNSPNPTFVRQELDGGDAPEYDPADMEILLRSRETAREILADSSRSVGETLALLLLYSYRVQTLLNGVEVSAGFDADALLKHARKYAKTGSSLEILQFLETLEILTPEWKNRLDNPAPTGLDDRYRTLARYFVDRYWLQAISDYDLVGRAKFALISCISVMLLGGNLVQTAQLYSKEIENSIENVEALLDATYDEPCFADVRLFGILLP